MEWRHQKREFDQLQAMSILHVSSRKEGSEGLTIVERVEETDPSPTGRRTGNFGDIGFGRGRSTGTAKSNQETTTKKHAHVVSKCADQSASTVISPSHQPKQVYQV